MNLYGKISKSIYIRDGIIYRGSDAVSAKEESEAKKQVDELKDSLENISNSDSFDSNVQNSSLLCSANGGNGGDGGGDGGDGGDSEDDEDKKFGWVINLNFTQVDFFFLTFILTLLHNHFIVKKEYQETR